MRGNISVPVVLMLLAGAQAQLSVTLSSPSFCAVTGSTVNIPCKYTYHYSSSVKKTEWYQVQRSDGEQQDLSKVLQYSGQVSVSTGNDCTLTMKNVKLSDSGDYNFRIRTWNNEWISAPSGITLTVTDLQVKVDPETLGQRKVKLTCSSTCSISKTLWYYWYRNGEFIRRSYASIELDSNTVNDEGSYSCRVSGSSHYFPAVCVLGKQCWNVTYTPERVCALKGSSVNLSCSYKFPGGHTVKKSFWFLKEQQRDGEPVDVREEEEYRGRVQYTHSSQNDCSMTITNLRESDAHTYKFRFHTDGSGGKYTGEPGVTLSVTDLMVAVSENPNYLICRSICTLSHNPTYIWYRNGQPVSNQNTGRSSMYVRSWGAGSYSCAVRGYEELRSPAVCVSNSQMNCWSVTYYPREICALIGSSVRIGSYYTFPNNQKVTKSFWFLKEQQRGGEPVDVREEEEYRGRVQYTHSSQNDCSMTITNLTESDAHTYKFIFHTDGYDGKYTGEHGVTLSVTDLKVTVSDSSGQKNLICNSTCTLSHNPTYIWYRNGQRVSRCTSASCSVSAVRDGDSYRCATEGHENLLSPPVYPPRNTRAVMVPSGERVEGDSVTLTCSSDANPPVLTYSWFKQRAAADILLNTDQNYSITNMSSQHSGLYYCTAHNQLGQHNSTTTLLDVMYPPRNTRAVMVPSGERVEGDSVTLTCSSNANPPVLTFYWFKQRAAADTLLNTDQNYSITNISSQHSGLYYCTAHNDLGDHNSTTTFLDVLYPPRVPSVTTDGSGGSVTLQCYSDSNPPSSYFWYQKTGSDVIPFGNGTSLTLASGAVGLFHCTAQNKFGSSNSTARSLPAGTTAGTYAASGVTVGLFLTLTAVFLWMRRRTAAVSSRSEETSAKHDSAPIYDNISAMTSDPTQTASSDDQEDIHYSSVHFTRSQTQEMSLYSTVQLPKVLNQEEEVEYATVNIIKTNVTVGKDKAHIYSTVTRT